MTKFFRPRLQDLSPKHLPNFCISRLSRLFCLWTSVLVKTPFSTFGVDVPSASPLLPEVLSVREKERNPVEILLEPSDLTGLSISFFVLVFSFPRFSYRSLFWGSSRYSYFSFKDSRLKFILV